MPYSPSDALERLSKFAYGVHELARMLPDGVSEHAIKANLRDADGQPVKPSDVVDGQAWLHLFGQQVPVHLHDGKHVIVFFRRDLERAFGELFHTPVLANYYDFESAADKAAY